MTKRDKQIHKLFSAEAIARFKARQRRIDSGETLEKMFRDCGRPIEFLDCVATDGAKSTTPTVKPKGKL